MVDVGYIAIAGQRVTERDTTDWPCLVRRSELGSTHLSVPCTKDTHSVTPALQDIGLQELPSEGPSTAVTVDPLVSLEKKRVDKAKVRDGGGDDDDDDDDDDGDGGGGGGDDDDDDDDDDPPSGRDPAGAYGATDGAEAAG
jgi:hypothetical protein